MILSLLFLLAITLPAGAPYHTQPTGPGGSSAGAANVERVKVQVETARTHAGFAAGGDTYTLPSVQQHLGHALNCLEGPKGANFNPSWGNVCQGQGNGILVDLKVLPNNTSLMALAKQAGRSALQGLKKQSLPEAKAAAKKTADLLQRLGGRLK